MSPDRVRRAVPLALLLASWLKVLIAASAPAEDLFLPVGSVVTRTPGAVGAASEYLGPTLRYRHARIDPGLLGQARAAAARGASTAGLIDLNLFEDASYRLAGVRAAPTSVGYSLTGELEGVPLSSATLVVNGDVIAGEVRLPGETYTIRSVGDVAEIRETDEQVLPECAEPRAPPPVLAGAVAAGGDLRSLGFQAGTALTHVDILVVYTTAAKDKVGGEAAMEALIDLWIAASNRIFERSGVNSRIRLAHAEELDYVETASSFELTPLRRKGDGFMDQVHAMRDLVGADLVHLIERWGVDGTLGYCGAAYLMRDVGASFAEYAFAVTDVDCGSITFVHELGHNMGLNHDRYAEDVYLRLTNRPHTHSYGYVNQEAFASNAPSSARWMTIMAYTTQCRDAGIDCTRIGRFSNPALTHGGDPLGVWRNGVAGSLTGPADAAATLNETRTTVAAWRSATSAPQVVSLKRRTPADERTGSDSLTWRLAFSRDVRNLTHDDFELSGSGLGTTTLTATARTGSRRIYDIAVSGGVDGFDGAVTLGFASGQDIRSLSDVDLVAVWPAHAERRYTLDNSAPTPAISPSSAGSSPFVATIAFGEDVTGFSDAADVTATNATVTAPSRSDARTYTVEVTPTVTAATITLSVVTAAATDLAGNSSVAVSQDVAWDPSTASSLTVSGYSDGSVAENTAWTSAAPATGGRPPGPVSWTKEGSDADLFTIKSSTGVLELPGQDYEKPADADGDLEFEVTARATDAKGNSATAGVNVTVTDAVEPRSLWVARERSRKIVDGSSFASQPFLTCRHDLNCRQAGAITPATWTKTGVDEALFSQARNGALHLGNRDFEAPADADGDNEYLVTVHGADADGNTASRTVKVQVIKGPPRWLAVSGVSSGTVGDGSVWTSSTPAALGASGAVTWTCEGPDAALFSLDSAGVLTLAAQDHDNPADADGDNVFEVWLRATDTQGNSGTAQLAVTVDDRATPGNGDPGDDDGPPPYPPRRPPRAVIIVDAECTEALCRAGTGSPVSFTDTSTGAVTARRWEFGDGRQSRGRTVGHVWSEPGFYEVTLTVSGAGAESTASLTFLVEAAEPAGTCIADARTRCLRDSRYAVAVEWLRADGEGGSGSVVHSGTNDSGVFRFFDSKNWEVLVKVLDGCAVNGHVWVFGASPTDLGFVIRVTDTVTGAVKEYRNEPGLPAAAITDTTAFPEGSFSCSPTRTEYRTLSESKLLPPRGSGRI